MGVDLLEQKPKGKALQIATVITYLLMIVVNMLANLLPLNGVNTGQVSDSYPNLFAPAGITFAIWGVIYLLLAMYSLYQLGMFQPKNPDIKSHLTRNVNILFCVSSVANSIWIFAWHSFNLPLTMLLMLVILACLIWINQLTKKETLRAKEKIFVRLPFSVYFGWITVATIANATAFLVSIHWNGFGIPEPVWAVLILIVGTFIGAATIIRNRDFAYGLVLIWAYVGIYIKHTSATGFAGQYPLVVFAVVACIILFAVAEIYTLLQRRITKQRVPEGTAV